MWFYRRNNKKQHNLNFLTTGLRCKHVNGHVWLILKAQIEEESANKCANYFCLAWTTKNKQKQKWCAGLGSCSLHQQDKRKKSTRVHTHAHAHPQAVVEISRIQQGQQCVCVCCPHRHGNAARDSSRSVGWRWVKCDPTSRGRSRIEK